MAIKTQSQVLAWSESNIGNAPDACGVYTLRTGTSLESIGYIGYAGARRLKSRLMEHWTSRDRPQTTHFCWTECTDEKNAQELEQSWISKYKPPWNG